MAGSCIAFNNYKIFIAFLGYISFGSMFVAFNMGIDIFFIFDTPDIKFAEDAKKHCYVASILDILIMLGITFLLIQHLFYSFSSQSSAESSLLK